MSFWEDMKLWEKMLLVLACGIAMTLGLGVGKVIYNKYQIRKYTKLAAARKLHQDGHAVAQLNKIDEIPFGIRAIEAGLEVEGVVISRPVTPTSSRPNQSQLTLVGSDADSMKSRNNGPMNPGYAQVHTGGHSTPTGSQPMRQVYQPSPYLSLPPPIHGGSQTPSGQSSTSSVASTPSLTRASSTDQPGLATGDGALSPGSRTGYTTPDPATLARLEGKLQSSANAKNRVPSFPFAGPSGTHPSNHTPSRTPSPPETLTSSLPGGRSNALSESSSGGSESSTDTDSPYSRPHFMTAYSTPEIGTVHSVHRALPESAQGDLSLLHTHRLSHAAEVGQLMPRRRDRQSQLAGMAPPGSPTSNAFYSPAVSDPVYALDIALPQTELALSPDMQSTSQPSLTGPTSDSTLPGGDASRFMEGPWNSPQADSSDREERRSIGSVESGRMGVDTVEYMSTVGEVPHSAVLTDNRVSDVYDKAENKKLKKLQKKKKGSDIDLEAQV